MESVDESSEQQSVFMVLPSQKDSALEEERKILSNLPALKAKPSRSNSDADSVPDHLKSLKPSESTSDEEQRRSYKIIVPAADSEIDVVAETSCDENKATQVKQPSNEDTSKERPENTDSDVISLTPSVYIGALQFSGKPMIIPDTVDDEGSNEEHHSIETEGAPIIIPSSPTEVIEESDDDSQDFALRLSMSQSQCSDRHAKTPNTSITSEQDSVSFYDATSCITVLEINNNQSEMTKVEASPNVKNQESPNFCIPGSISQTSQEEKNLPSRPTSIESSTDIHSLTSFRLEKPDFSVDNEEENAEESIFKQAKGKTGLTDKRNIIEEDSEVLLEIPAKKSNDEQIQSLNSPNDVNREDVEELCLVESETTQKIINVDSPSPSLAKIKVDGHRISTQQEDREEYRLSGKDVFSKVEEMQYVSEGFSANNDSSSQKSKFQENLEKSTVPAEQTTESPVLKAQSDPYVFHGSQSQIEDQRQYSEPIIHSAKMRPIVDTPTSSAKKERYKKMRKVSRERYKVQDNTEKKVDQTTNNSPPPSPPLQSSKEVHSVTEEPSLRSGSNITTTQGSGERMETNTLSHETLSHDRRQSVESNSSFKHSFQATGLSYSTPTDSDEGERPKIRTLVKEYVEKITRRVITVEKHFHGSIIESKTVEEKDPPIILETRTSETVKYLSPRPSPSRSVSTLTSGDLADISSLSTQISSLSSRTGSLPSLEKIYSISDEISPINQSLDHVASSGQNPIHGSISNSENFPKPLDRKRKRVNSSSAKSKESSPEIVSSTVKNVSHVKNTAKSLAPSDSLFSSTPEQEEIDLEKDQIQELHSEPDSSSDGHNKFFSENRHEETDLRASVPSGRNVSAAKALSSHLTSSESDSSKRSKKVRFSDVGVETASGNISEPRSPEIPYQDEKNLKESEPESLVMAKWKDGYFYPGKIIESTSCGKYRIEFVDGDKMIVKACDILIGDQFPVGQDVMVLGKDHCFEMGRIVENANKSYLVEKINGDQERHKHRDIILSPNQVSEIVKNGFTFASDDESQIPNYAHISLENLVEGVRSARKARPKNTPSPRKQKTPDSKGKRKLEKLEGPKAPTTTTSGKKRGRKPKLDSEEGKGRKSPIVEEFKKATVPARKKLKIDIEETAFTDVVQSPSRSTRSSSKPAADSMPVDYVMPVKKTLFKGYSFLLTNVNKTEQQKEMEKKMLQDSSLDTSAEDSSMEESINLPFDKDEIIMQITNGGGHVIDRFDEEENKLLESKSYLLPSGISIQRKKLMEWNPRGDTLTGMRFLILSNIKKFVEAWTSVLLAAKCKVFTEIPPGKISDKLDCTITDITSDNSDITKLKQSKVPVVSTEWVIQSLINGCVVPFDGHPRYSHTFVEKSRYSI